MQTNLTKRQREIYGVIERYIKNTGFAPSYTSIARIIGVSSRATINKHINAMERRGVLKKTGYGTGFQLQIGDFEPHAIAPRYSKKAIPLEVRWQIWERDNFTCLKCKTRRMLTIDHIKPWKLGGSDDPENLQTLCNPCNTKKGQRTKDYRGVT